MGIYIDPGNSGFQRIVSSEYVDKTGWKSYAAQMLCAYYDCSCDSRSLFDDKEIAGTEGYLAHLNQYQVINLDITSFLSVAQRKGIPLKEVPDMIVDGLSAELSEIYPDCARSIWDI